MGEIARKTGSSGIHGHVTKRERSTIRRKEADGNESTRETEEMKA